MAELFAKGDAVVVNGLNSRPDLNGKAGRVLHFNKKRGRFAVLIAGEADGMMIKAANMTLVPPEDAQGAADRLAASACASAVSSVSSGKGFEALAAAAPAPAALPLSTSEAPWRPTTATMTALVQEPESETAESPTAMSATPQTVTPPNGELADMMDDMLPAKQQPLTKLPSEAAEAGAPPPIVAWLLDVLKLGGCFKGDGPAAAA